MATFFSRWPSSERWFGNYSQPSWFFEYDGNAFFKTNDPPNSNCRTMDSRQLLLPDAA